MKPYLKVASLILLAVLVFIPLQPAAAKGTFDGQVIFGQSYTLKSGDSLQGDLVVIGGSATIEEGATVIGNLVLVGGSLSIQGEVTGDVAVVGGSAALGAKSHIIGNLTTVGASLERTEGYLVDGEITNAATSWTTTGSNGATPTPPQTNPPTTPPVTPRPEFNIDFHPLSSFLNAVSQSVGMALLAMLVLLFLAPQAGRIAQTITGQPLVAGGLGLLTLIVTPVVVLLLTLTILLIPVVVVLILALIVAGAFGWIALGYEIGLRFTKAIHQEWHPSFAAGLGTFALSLISAALTGIPVLNCVGWFIPFILAMAGLGAVIMTRFGTQAASMPTPKPVVPPVDPTALPPAG